MLLGGCLSGAAPEWNLAQVCLLPSEPVIERSTAEQVMWERLREMDNAGSGPRLQGAHVSDATLACGLQRASHAAGWRYHAAAQDVWLLTVRRAGVLVALAAIGAADGEVRAITYGIWEDRGLLPLASGSPGRRPANPAED